MLRATTPWQANERQDGCKHLPDSLTFKAFKFFRLLWSFQKSLWTKICLECLCLSVATAEIAEKEHNVVPVKSKTHAIILLPESSSQV